MPFFLSSRAFFSAAFFASAAFCAAVSIVAAPHAPAAYPEKAIRLVVPFGAGGSTDMVARLPGVLRGGSGGFCASGLGVAGPIGSIAD